MGAVCYDHIVCRHKCHSNNGGDQTHINTASTIVDATLSANSDTVDNSTTRFTTDSANTNVACIQQVHDIGNKFNNLRVYKQQDIKEFLRKPQVLLQGSFGIADTGIMATIVPHQSLITLAMNQRKMEGHLAYRAKVVIRIVINANRFQQGRYFLAWFPDAGSVQASANAQSVSWFNLHCATLCQRTQLNKVEFDLNRDSEAIFEIPWQSAYTHMPVRSGYVNTYARPGRLLLCAYSPLVAPTGSVTAPYTIYGHFEDLELVAPTAPQSNVRFKKTDVQTQEQRSAGLGPISSTLANVSKAADIVSEIPMLSAITAPVAWFSDILSRAASVFGWSAPLDLSEVTRAVQTIFPFQNNCDMPKQSMPLSLFARNQLEILPGIAGTDIDETSIDHLKTIPAFFTSFNLTTSDAANGIVYTQSVGYTNYVQTIVDNARTITALAPISYLAQFFTHYRGGIVFRFKVISTEFHSGRYALEFYPTESWTGGTSTNAPEYVLREIIDLRSGCEFTFHIPFTSIPSYRVIGSNQFFGTMRLRTVNPLAAPSSVSSTVNVLVEVAGAPDVEFAYLRTAAISLASPSAPQSSVNFVSSENEIVSGSLGGSTLSQENCMSSRHCIGEKVLSLLSILKHTNQIVKVAAPVGALSVQFAPFAIFTNAYVGVVLSDSAYYSDHYSMFVSMFATSRGSVRLKVITNANETSASSIMDARVRFSNSGTTAGIQESATALPDERFLLRVLQNRAFRGGVDIQTPPYHHTYTRTNADELVGSGTLVKDYSTATANNLVIACDTNTANANSYYREVADDFHMAIFISTPCITTL